MSDISSVEDGANPLRACVAACAPSVTAAIVLYRIRWWQGLAVIGYDGRLWIAKSFLDWAEETGLSHDQLKIAFNNLRDKGLVYTVQKQFKGRVSLHTTMADKAVGLVGVHEHRKRGRKRGVHPDPLGGDQHLPESGDHHLPIEQEDTGKKIQQEDLAPASLDAMFGSETNVVDTEEETMPTVEEVVSGKLRRSKTDKAGLPAKWMTARSRHAPGEFIPGLTMQQKGQLKLIAQAFPDLDPTYKVAISIGGCFDKLCEGWSEFAARAKAAAGITTAPAEPNVGFVLKHVGVAVNFCLANPKARPMTKPKPAPSLKADVLPDEKPASAGEILAILNQGSGGG